MTEDLFMTTTTRAFRRVPSLVAMNIAAKLALIALLAHAALFPHLPQYDGKGIGARIATYPISALLVPLIWFIRTRLGRETGAYPHLIDLCVVLPFLIDTAGNAANLYDTVSWWDDAMHFVTWVPWVVAFGLLMLRRYSRHGRLIVAGLTLGFGAVTHILWEIAEYFAFIKGNPDELATAYKDTIGDLAMSLSGSVFGAVLVGTVLWHLGSDQPRPAQGTSGAETRGSVQPD
ncbi:MAG: hypothetical protein QOG53_1378 [Frankiales bacterium]|nr:hypothetical protein [Frankiales bacterium]